jgi:hypothetical protein
MAFSFQTNDLKVGIVVSCSGLDGAGTSSGIEDSKNIRMGRDSGSGRHIK